MPPLVTTPVPRAGSPRAGLRLAACGIFIGLVLASCMAWYITTSRQRVLDDAVREISNDARMLSEDEDRLLQAVDVVQRDLIEHMRVTGIDSPEKFEQSMASQAVHDNLRDRIAGLSYISALTLSDRHGTLLNTSRSWPVPSVNDADRDFIRDLTTAGARPAVISQPSRSKTNGRWSIYYSRRFETAGGRLIGFITSRIQIDYFEQIYARLPLTGEGTFTLYRRDGMLLARYPHTDTNIGKMFTTTPNFIDLLAALHQGAIRRVSVFDNADRLIVSEPMDHFPLFIVVSDTMDSILHDWRWQTRILIATTALLELAILGTFLLAVRHVGSSERLQAADAARAHAEAGRLVAEEHERAALALHQQEQRFDTAIQNMVQGVLMVDHHGIVQVINRRFCEISGVTMEAAPPGTTYADLVRIGLASGRSDPDELEELRNRRAERAGRTTRSTFEWKRKNGEVYMVTHVPLEDGWITTYEDITERRLIEARMNHLTNHDPLTGLPNRTQFRESLDHDLSFARRGRPLALHCIDLDQFKAVNDTLGHPIGDRLLLAVAERLQSCLRETDTIARLGGDEFAIVQTAVASPVDATALASRLIELIEAPFEIAGNQIIVGASIGIALAPQDGGDSDKVLKCADLALYRAKADGRGVYRLFQAEMDADMQARRILELDLRQALPKGQLELFYQPLISLHERRVAGFEALLRWRHPARGLVPPSDFVPLAEETGLIVPIGEWVLRQACTAAANWPGSVKVAVNLSVIQFKNASLVPTVVAALQESGLPASRLELEITESVMLQDTDTTLATLYKLSGLGIHIAMDDFGTGYSSLSYLRRFPFDRIKIDQSFVRELGEQDDCIAIVRAVTGLGRDLGMAITAEGVETRQQLEALERAGCTEIQGYLFSRPVPAASVPDLLRSMPILAELWPQSGSAIHAEPDEANRHAASKADRTLIRMQG